MIWLYRILFVPALLICSPHYLRRMFKRGGYADTFKQRFGFMPEICKKESKRFWIQAVSVGEVQAIAPLIDLLCEKGYEVCLTTTTSTGYAIAHKKYKDRLTHVGIFPLDFFLFSTMAWRQINPDVVILMEAELWPEHCTQAKRRDVPVYLINARLSDRSFNRYERVRAGAAWMLGHVNRILASSKQDAERFIALGADESQVEMSGNIKIDVNVSPILDAKGKDELLNELGFADSRDKPLVLLGASTWPGEEAMLLMTYELACKRGINCRLLIAPRHAERRNEIQAILETQDKPWHFRSTSKQADNDVQIYIADTTGELTRISQAADLVFIGKSLMPNIGGQTPIESAALGLPIVYGPKMNNFRDICRSLEKNEGAISTNHATNAREVLLELMEDGDKRQRLGENAKAWHEASQGATQKTFESITK